MLRNLSAVLVFSFACVSLLPACNTKPPRQADSVDAIEDKGADMPAAPQATAIAPVIEDLGKKCCGQCKAALAKDKTGAKPETIPCVDFTADLDPTCLEHFRGKKVMASECK
jgi:hypothetical protein